MAIPGSKHVLFFLLIVFDIIVIHLCDCLDSMYIFGNYRIYDSAYSGHQGEYAKHLCLSFLIQDRGQGLVVHTAASERAWM